MTTAQNSVSLASPAEDRDASWLARAKELGLSPWTAHRVSFMALIVIQLAVFSYFFTTLVFTNHTLPNSWQYGYPSFKTRGEGRWLADLIIALQGGSGVQSFQMALGVAVQSANGIFFAALVLGIRNRLEVFLIAALLCLYPAFLDNYSFTADNLTFAIGDTLALIGIVFCGRTPRGWRVAMAAIACFTLSIAAYQPKIALVVLLCIIQAVTSVVRGDDSTRDDRPFRMVAVDIAYPFVLLLLAVAVYFVSIKLTISQTLAERAYMSSVSEVMRAVLSAYHAFARYFTIDSDYLPLRLRFLPAAGIFLGSVALVLQARKRGALAVALTVLLLCLVPVALRSAYVINKYAWSDVGRILYVHAYALAFFIGCALQWRITEKLSVGLLVLLIYWCVLIDTQETSVAMLKTNYELGTVNRIASRVEDVTEDLYGARHPIVIIGHFPEFDVSKYLAHPNQRNQAQALTFGFEVYRQVEILNFVFGKDVVAWPSIEDVTHAISSSSGRLPWPARESVFLDGRAIVVLLERPRVGVPITWADGIGPPDTAVVNRVLRPAIP
jgi:hypothetical protein